MLEIAVLGLLDQQPMHGYHIRKVLTEMSGGVRGISYGSLYPILNRLEREGLVTSLVDNSALLGRRKAKKVYQLTPQGSQHFLHLLEQIPSASLSDDDFGIRLAFFHRTSPEARLRLLEGRRRLLEERRDQLHDALQHPVASATLGEGASLFTSPHSMGLQELALDNIRREITWVNKLIAEESA